MDIPRRVQLLVTPTIAMTLSDKRILLIIGGGIAACKSLDLIRGCASAAPCAPS